MRFDSNSNYCTNNAFKSIFVKTMNEPLPHFSFSTFLYSSDSLSSPSCFSSFDKNSCVEENAEQNHLAVPTPKKQQFFKTKICPWYFKCKCNRGNDCQFAHSQNEIRIAPDLSKTSLCPVIKKYGSCYSTSCKYAHNLSELRATGEIFKTALCVKWLMRKCNAGASCRHAHGLNELKGECFDNGQFFDFLLSSKEEKKLSVGGRRFRKNLRHFDSLMKKPSDRKSVESSKKCNISESFDKSLTNFPRKNDANNINEGCKKNHDFCSIKNYCMEEEACRKDRIKNKNYPVNHDSFPSHNLSSSSSSCLFSLLANKSSKAMYDNANNNYADDDRSNKLRNDLFFINAENKLEINNGHSRNTEHDKLNRNTVISSLPVSHDSSSEKLSDFLDPSHLNDSRMSISYNESLLSSILSQSDYFLSSSVFYTVDTSTSPSLLSSVPFSSTNLLGVNADHVLLSNKKSSTESMLFNSNSLFAGGDSNYSTALTHVVSESPSDFCSVDQNSNHSYNNNNFDIGLTNLYKSLEFGVIDRDFFQQKSALTSLAGKEGGGTVYENQKRKEGTFVTISENTENDLEGKVGGVYNYSSENIGDDECNYCLYDNFCTNEGRKHDEAFCFFKLNEKEKGEKEKEEKEKEEKEKGEKEKEKEKEESDEKDEEHATIFDSVSNELHTECDINDGFKDNNIFSENILDNFIWDNYCFTSTFMNSNLSNMKNLISPFLTENSNSIMSSENNDNASFLSCSSCRFCSCKLKRDSSPSISHDFLKKDEFLKSNLLIGNKGGKEVKICNEGKEQVEEKRELKDNDEVASKSKIEQNLKKVVQESVKRAPEINSYCEHFNRDNNYYCNFFFSDSTDKMRMCYDPTTNSRITTCSNENTAERNNENNLDFEKDSSSIISQPQSSNQTYLYNVEKKSESFEKDESCNNIINEVCDGKDKKSKGMITDSFNNANSYRSSSNGYYYASHHNNYTNESSIYDRFYSSLPSPQSFLSFNLSSFVSLSENKINCNSSSSRDLKGYYMNIIDNNLNTRQIDVDYQPLAHNCSSNQERIHGLSKLNESVDNSVNKCDYNCSIVVASNNNDDQFKSEEKLLEEKDASLLPASSNHLRVSSLVSASLSCLSSFSCSSNSHVFKSSSSVSSNHHHFCSILFYGPNLWNESNVLA